MNYLAHLFLAGDSVPLIIGNFIGDSVKGNDLLDYPEEIKQGIIMHRAIDTFTDHHPTVKQSIQRLHPHYHKFSGILVDIFYDHFLAVHWNKFHAMELNDFAQKSYAILEQNKSLLPDRAKFILPYMVKGNWLYHYNSIEGISRTLGGMHRRSTFENKMNEGAIHLKEFYADFEKEFFAFFPELATHTLSYKKP